MKRILYPECASGISGDMAVGALLDLGASEEKLREILHTIPLAEPYEIRISRVKKAGLDTCDFDVVLPEEIDPHDHDMEYLHGTKNMVKEKDSVHEGHTHTHGHRGPGEIRELYQASAMSEGAKAVADRILTILAEAEAKVHDVPVSQVHFHEVGAVDSVIDIAAFAICFDEVCHLHGIDEVIVTGLTEGRGTVRCQHGILPVPVPAVTQIVTKHRLPLRLTQIEGELVTPTGAAIAAAIATGCELPEECRILSCGLGAGKRAYETAGFLRMMLLEV